MRCETGNERIERTFISNELSVYEHGDFEMSFLDKIAAKVAPAASDEARAEARRKAESLSASEEWLALILQQHRQIEELVTEALSAQGTDARQEAVRELGRVLTGHATAEEAVLYPDVSEFSGKTHAGMGTRSTR
jgi:predicted Holliday junction resolvase-like endonuclease|tara:strand:- start:8949 stop:9353 length:405 start_codon:yes stop_codon:yes gene_type:complete